MYKIPLFWMSKWSPLFDLQSLILIVISCHIHFLFLEWPVVSVNFCINSITYRITRYLDYVKIFFFSFLFYFLDHQNMKFPTLSHKALVWALTVTNTFLSPWRSVCHCHGVLPVFLWLGCLFDVYSLQVCAGVSLNSFIFGTFPVRIGINVLNWFKLLCSRFGLI